MGYGTRAGGAFRAGRKVAGGNRGGIRERYTGAGRGREAPLDRSTLASDRDPGRDPPYLGAPVREPETAPQALRPPALSRGLRRAASARGAAPRAGAPSRRDRASYRAPAERAPLLESAGRGSEVASGGVSRRHGRAPARPGLAGRVR